jgi:cytochrome c oxidase subunit II
VRRGNLPVPPRPPPLVRFADGRYAPGLSPLRGGITIGMSGDRVRRRRRPCRPVAPVALFVPVLVAGCGKQDVLDPHSDAERRISTLWWVMLGGAAIGFGVIVLLLFLGWVRRNRASLPFGGGEQAATALVIALGVAVPIVVLSALFVWSNIFLIRTTDAPAPGSTSLTVRVIGHQWWWEIRYPGTRAVTANELHIPVATGVRVAGTTADVIHSLWVPELNRKVDVIPGRENVLLLDADHTGTYPGQCAEFCGLQHAHMEIRVIAEPRQRFQAWLAREASPAAAATSRGARVFVDQACSGCHQIRGTDARGLVGPDLTHFGSRTTIGAGVLPNDREHLRDWIRDPQHAKPGNRMPALKLSEADLRALVDYLEGLK